MPDLSDNINWSEVDANNNQPPPNGWPEGMMPSGVNDAARADRGAIKRWWNKLNPVQSITPSGNLWTFTTGNVAYPTSYVPGEIYCFYPNASSVGSDLFQVNALGAKPILKHETPGVAGWIPIIAFDMRVGHAAQLIYDPNLNAGTGAFALLNPVLPIQNDGTGYGVNLASLTIYNPGAPSNFVVQSDGGFRATTRYIGLGSPSTHIWGVGLEPTHGNFAINDATTDNVRLQIDTVGNATFNSPQLTVVGSVSAVGYQSRSGVPGPSQNNYFNIQWDGSAPHLWIDGSDLGLITTAPPGGNVALTGNVSIGGTLGVTGATTLGSNLTVSGTSTLGNASVGGTLGVTGATTLGNASVGGTLGVTGATTLGNASVGGTLGVTGATTLTGGLTVPGGISLAPSGLIQAAGLEVSGGASVSGELEVGTGLVVHANGANITGDISGSGALTVVGQVQGENLRSIGDSYIGNNLYVTGLINGHPAAVFDTLTAQVAELTSRVAALEATIATLRG